MSVKLFVKCNINFMNMIQATWPSSMTLHIILMPRSISFL